MKTPPILGSEIARYLRRELGASAMNEHYEDVLGFIEDRIFDSLCACRGVSAARGGAGDPREAFVEAGKSLARLTACMDTLRAEALKRRSAPV